MDRLSQSPVSTGFTHVWRFMYQAWLRVRFSSTFDVKIFLLSFIYAGRQVLLLSQKATQAVFSCLYAELTGCSLIFIPKIQEWYVYPILIEKGKGPKMSKYSLNMKKFVLKSLSQEQWGLQTQEFFCLSARVCVCASVCLPQSTSVAAAQILWLICKVIKITAGE